MAKEPTLSNFPHLVLAVLWAAWTFIYRVVDRSVLALQMAVLSLRRRTARDHGPLNAVPSGGAPWQARSSENC
jgi:hypothetical protein